MSNSQVSELAKSLDGDVEAFRSRPLDAGPHTYLALDALTQKVSVAERGAGRTVRAASADGPAYLAKAHEYLEAAEDALGRDNFVAAAGNAVHATIAAADAVASTRLGSRWRSDHPGAAEHVAAGRSRGRAVRPKPYDPVPMAPAKARAAIRAAAQAL